MSTAREELALAVDYSIRPVKKADWRGNRFKEREVRNSLAVLPFGESQAVPVHVGYAKNADRSARVWLRATSVSSGQISTIAFYDVNR